MYSFSPASQSLGVAMNFAVPHLLLSSFLFFTALPSALRAIPIDNGVVGHPEVSCGAHSIRVSVNTEKAFNGKLFVKGESGRDTCTRTFDYGVGGFPQSQASPGHAPYSTPGQGVGMELKFGECNMRRQRTLYPKGVEYTFTLVVSFHPLFITKVDRAYRVRCFYMEADKNLNAALDVSMLTTHQLNEQFPMPQCRYTLKRGGHDGPPLRYAKVGDKVVHLWECDRSASYLYGILVKSCFVDDGHGNKAELISDEGCARDQHLIPSIHYGPDLFSAYVETHVFKYPDRANLQFTCTIQLCFKADGGCDGITPPKCPYGSVGGNHHHPGPSSGGHGPSEGGYPPSSGGHPPGSYPPPEQDPPSYPGPQSRESYPSEPRDPYPPPHPYEGSESRPPPETHIPQALRPRQPLRGDGPLVFAGGPPPPPGPYEPIHRGGNYKLDDPVKSDEDKSSSPNPDNSSKKKRAVENRNESDETLETDLTAPTLVVLPMDESLEDAEDQLRQLDLLEERALVPDFRYLGDHGVCLSSSGFGILVALALTLLAFSTILSCMFIRKYWLRSISNAKA